MSHIEMRSYEITNGVNGFQNGDTVDGGVSRLDTDWQLTGGGFHITRGAGLSVGNSGPSFDSNGDPVGWAVQGKVENVPGGTYDAKVVVFAFFLVPDEA